MTTEEVPSTNPNPKPNIAYLGDGAYASDRGPDIKVYASNGVFETNAVYLGDEEMLRLLWYVRTVRPHLIAAFMLKVKGGS